jgi:hypothetical protein
MSMELGLKGYELFYKRFFLLALQPLYLPEFEILSTVDYGI